MKLVQKLPVIAGGYVVAVTVATMLTTFFYFAPMALPDQGQLGSIYHWWSDIPMFLLLGGSYTFAFALPGFIGAIALGEWLRWSRWTHYAIAGALDAVLAHVLLAQFFGANLMEMRPMFTASIIGGFAGGVAYWWTAGRFVAQRRTMVSTSPAPSGS